MYTSCILDRLIPNPLFLLWPGYEADVNVYFLYFG